MFLDNTIDGITPTAVSATNNVIGGQKAGAYIKTQLKSGDTIGLMVAVKGVPNLDQRIDGVKRPHGHRGQGRLRRPADHLRPEDRWSGRSGPAHQVPPPHRYVLRVRLPGRRCRRCRQAEGPHVKIFGYDGDPEMAKMILSGETTATMAQSPFKMTYLGITSAINSIEGKPYARSSTPARRWSRRRTPRRSPRPGSKQTAGPALGRVPDLPTTPTVRGASDP